MDFSAAGERLGLRCGRYKLGSEFLWRKLAGYVLCLFLSLAASASVTENDLGQFHHSAWNASAGAPHDVWSIAQGADGYLWLGTGEGLYQFDGVTFRPQKALGPALATSNITALAVFPNGDLWEGFYLGGVALIRHGRAQIFGKADDFPAGWVLDFAQTQDGAIWAAAKQGLARYQNGKWQTIGRDWGLPPNGAGWVLVDREGTLWVSGPSSLFFLAKGSRLFQDTGIPLGQGAVLALDRDGTLWVSDKVRGTRSLPGVTAHHPHLSKPSPSVSPGFIMSNRILFDRNGHMWGTDSQAGGIYVVLDPKAIADGRSLHATDLSFTYKRANGLTSDLTDPLLGDLEGNVWVGTNFGIDSFRLTNVSSVSKLDVIPGVDFNVAVDVSGGVWVINGYTIYQVNDGKLHAIFRSHETIHDLVSADDGSLWFETDTDVLRIKDGAVTRLGLPANVTEAASAAFTSDGHGGAWMAFRDDHLYHWSKHHWSRADTSFIDDTPTVLARDGDNLWIGFTNDRIAVQDEHGTHVFSANDGLSIGAVSSFNITDSWKLVGGEEGLARFKDGRFQSLSSFGENRVAGISGIAYRNGTFWLNTNKGVIRISSTELKKAFEMGSYVPVYKLFQYRDGLPGFALQSRPISTALVDGKGQIWFDTDLGIAWIDPSDIRTNNKPPHVEVVDVSSNGKRNMPDQSSGASGAILRLPKQTSNLAIEYTATSLSVPEGVTFLYKLDGVDDTWQDVGTRREAFYANVAPGTYTFRVTAKNEDGVWSTHPASITLYIPPMFYQTIFFRVACIVLAIGLVALFLIARMNKLAENIRIRVSERYMERERIARELHDTLLQSVQGLTMVFESTVKRAPSGDAPPEDIENVLTKADDVLAEVRSRVLDLRKDAEHYPDLPGEFSAISEECAKRWNPGTVSFRVVVNGSGRLIPPLIQEEIYWIGREAIINAYKHADARVVEVVIDYDSSRFRIRFRDDGCGIDENVVRNGGKPGHWGLKGMQERAQRMGGTLQVQENEGAGTEVELSIPSRVAYIGRLAPLRDALLRTLNRSSENPSPFRR